MMTIELHSLSAEQALIGGLMLEPYRIDDLPCSVNDLWDSSHKSILTAMLELSEKNIQIDIITIAEKLESQHQLVSVGGLAYLGELQQNSVGGSNLKAYANTIRDHALRRELSEAVFEIGGKCNDKSMTATELVSDAEARIFALNEKRETHEPVSIKTAVDEALEKLSNIIDGVKYQSSGLTDLDKLTGGLHGGAVYVIAARPSMGKTALACSIAHSIAKDAKNVYFATLEMPRREIATRLIAIDGNVNVGNVKEWKSEDYDRLHVGSARVNELPIIIDHEEGLTIPKLRSRARRMKRKTGLDCIVVDYLQLMKQKASSREQEIAGLSGGIKSLAKELDVPIILLAQLNRDCDSRADRRPLLSDLRESGAIEQDADVVVMLYRDEVYNKDSQYKGTAELLVRKNRHGATGDIFTSFNKETMRFYDIAHEWEKPLNVTPIKANRGFN
jgi:replicative DNA helicase